MPVRFQLVIIASLTSLLVAALVPKPAGGSPIGVCYGMLGNDLPTPKDVISMYSSHQISRIRLYNPDPSALEALRGSNIQVLVGVRNEDLQQLSLSYNAAQTWVATNILSYWPDVHFRYISVGNEVVPSYLSQYVLKAMQNLHNALSIDGLWHHIKVSTSVASSVMGVSYPPSEGSFSTESTNYMVPIAHFLNEIGAPLLANVYPYFSYIGDTKDISLSYALLTSKNVVVRDGHLSYYNLFNAIIDALHASLEKAGAPQVEVVVSETGWPSAGGDENVANKENAHVYNLNVVRHVLSSAGTPKWPGRPIETYLFAMFNENLKGGDAVEQHWGLFYPNMTPVYPLDFFV